MSSWGIAIRGRRADWWRRTIWLWWSRRRASAHLPPTFEQAERATALSGHLRDPCDRMLIAQAQLEGLVLVTRDARIMSHPVSVVPV
ncbi:MAG: PIN domain-containing protein [Gemmatimonadetes bacterium]|nr:PIN domain-containing protein [Gemmatimonadota bacterium]